MTTTKKLKIWTLITHGLIIIGAGHGILFFFIIEILAFPYITKNNFSFSFDTVDNHFPVIGLLSLLGQIASLFSIFQQGQLLKMYSRLSGFVYFGVVWAISFTTQQKIHIPILL